MLMDIARTATDSSLEVHVSIFVTCLCNPDAVPDIPNSLVTLERPSVHKILRTFVTPPALGLEDGVAKGVNVEEVNSLQWIGDGGGVAVCASGPESMVVDAQNAVARVSASTAGRRIGGLDLHTELFGL